MFPLPVLLLVALLLILMPFIFGEVMFASLSKLHLSPTMAFVCVIAIFAGSLFDIPVKSVVRDWDVIEDPLAIYGIGRFWPQLRRVRRRTVIAVNVGGCLIPLALVLYEITLLATTSASALAAAAVGCLANVVVCYFAARPKPGVGIVMPGVISPMVALILALWLAPDRAPPVAFIIGVTGPLVGADLLHLRDIALNEIGLASIGGAGTFDGIVLSGIVAAYLA